MDKINVSLYGGKSIFGGKESPLEADIIYCDKYNSCSYYKNNTCMKLRGFDGYCKFGKRESIKGYTSRARKYREFKNKYESDEVYNKLNRPNNSKLGMIDNFIILNYSHMTFDNDLNLINPWLTYQNIFYIPKEIFTVDFIYKIVKFHPQAMMGGEITSYQKEIVPLFLSHLNETMNDLYLEFIDKYKEFNKQINYVGRKAILKTINPSYINDESRNYPNLDSHWYWDGEYIIYKSGYIGSFSITKDYEVEELKLKPSDKSIIKIENNFQVNENTIFVD